MIVPYRPYHYLSSIFTFFSHHPITQSDFSHLEYDTRILTSHMVSNGSAVQTSLLEYRTTDTRVQTESKGPSARGQYIILYHIHTCVSVLSTLYTIAKCKNMQNAECTVAHMYVTQSNESMQSFMNRIRVLVLVLYSR